MARALGCGWVAAGHEVLVGARSPERVEELAVGARSGTIRDAAEFGDATLLAVPVAALADVLGSAAFDGRTVIDCTNAFEPDDGSMVLGEEAVAERVAALAPGARVVKAFNLLAADVWESADRVFEGRRLVVPLCGDDPDALAQVEGLVHDLKALPVRAGGLHRARYLEAMSVFVVGLWFAGVDARAVLPPLEAAFAIPD